MATRTAAEWISIQQLADEFGIPIRTIYNWRSQGKGPRGHSIGRHVRFKRSDVDTWLEGQADDREAVG